MPEYDACHYQVENALRKAGWIVDKVPFHVTDKFGNDFFIDLTALPPRNSPELVEIAVEVKCFGLPKKTADLHRAIGQCIVYQELSIMAGYTFPVYMAVPTASFDQYLNQRMLAVLQKHGISIIEVDLAREEIIRWIAS